MRKPSAKKKLSKTEWYFRDIPPDEIPACYFFEYYRETGLIIDPDLPWATLPKARKEHLRPRLEYALRSDAGARRFPIPNLVPDAMPPEPVFESEDGFKLGISWAYTDAEITAAFREWLLRNRPEGFSNTKGRKRSDFLAGLECLGVMRLLHHMNPRELERADSEAWDWMKRRAYFRDRKSALSHFRNLFRYQMEFFQVEARSCKTAAQVARGDSKKATFPV